VNLKELAQILRCETPAEAGTAVTVVTEDSRRARPGAVFFALPGERADGHDFARKAVEAGAIAVVGGRTGLKEFAGAPYLCVANPRAALGEAAQALAGYPSRAMTVIGITGTNGKTSSVRLTHHVLETCGHPAADFGTLGYQFGGVVRETKHTTPFAEDLAAVFAEARAAGSTHIVMEVSSHSLDQERVAGIEFDVAAFTNLTQDHLDYHRDMDSYLTAKRRLFEKIAGPRAFTVVNLDDPAAEAFQAASHVPCYTFGAAADCRASGIVMELDATRFHVDTPWGAADIRLRMLGRHNVSNALCAIAIGGGLGLPMEGVAAGIEALDAVPGRFQQINAGQAFQVIVDYAHTDDGLRNVLRAAREICSGRIIAVFGCGGDRDRTKRPKMAAAVAELADFGIVTSDNPRTEDPDRIIQDVEAGMVAAGKTRGVDYWVIPDRAEAIERGILAAQSGDLVMIAGKGHEDYQILGTERIHFDDREVARAILERR
jgi:UDP-N-acetylmuramoyl-L-alanyl-D-glutamate--2,6-diaminopimelate ligase